VETEWETLGRRRLAEEREKGALENHLSFSLFPSTSRATARRGAKRYAGGTKGGNREEEGFVAERGFQRSQLLDASRSAGAGRGVVACIDVKREFREFRLSRARVRAPYPLVSCVGSLAFDSSRV